MRRFASALLLCAGWMIALAPALVAETQAAQWYVSGAGSDATGCGTFISPCETISYLLPAVAAGDQINVIDAITDNITLTKNVTIAGVSGASIDGNGERVITVNAGVNAALNNLTLHNGGGAQDGGLIHNAGTLTINNATLTQSTLSGANGGAIYNAGLITITGSIISNNAAQYGGGIENHGALFVSTSTILNNAADYGGGIDNFSNGTVHLYRAVVMNNAAPSGAGIYNDFGLTTRVWLTETAVVSNTASNEAGGIFNGGQLSLVNATVSHNRLNSGLGAALDHRSGSLSMQYVTIAGNMVANATDSSALNLAGSATIRNSVIANSGLDNCSGSAASAGYNLSSDGSCGFFNQSTDASNVDARLGPLQHSSITHATYTHSPLRDSPLVNRIPSAVCGSASDQRAVPRPQDGACDIGAHEVVPVDLSLTAQATPAALPAGTPLTVTLNAANAGPAIATSVMVTSELPAGVGLKDCAGAVSCVASGGRLTVTLGTLNAGANTIATVRLTPQQSGNLAMSFVIAGNEWDRQMTNNSANANASVMKSADLSIRLSGALVVQPHTTFTLTVEVENTSDSAADSPVFTLALPANATFSAAQGASWTCSQSAGVVSCVAQASLLARGISQVVITLNSADAPAELHFIGSATSNTFDPDSTNNTAAMTMIVGSGSTIALPIVLR